VLPGKPALTPVSSFSMAPQSHPYFDDNPGDAHALRTKIAAPRGACAPLAFIVALLLLSGGCGARAADRAGVAFPEPDFDFGRVVRGDLVEHEFVVRNEGTVPVRIQKASMTPPLLATRMPGVIAPGATANIATRLDTSQLQGRFQGELVVYLDDPSQSQVALSFEGEVLGTIEVAPMPALFVVGQRGGRAERAVELINHEDEPLQILEIRYPHEAFSTTLETLLPGQRYRLTVKLRTDGPGGRRSDPILVRTSSRSMPSIRIVAHTYLRDRVYVFPDSVDLGALRLAQIKSEPALLERLAQTLMVYQFDGTDFQTRLDTDVPGLTLTSERGPRGDRYQITVQLQPDELRAGDVAGSIRIRTNDPEFPEVVVPVHGRITDL
jgi:Protein of unknown function (DUF1573)